MEINDLTIGQVKELVSLLNISNGSNHSNLPSGLVGKWVICRTRNEGVNFGRVESYGIGFVVLSSCRRMHYFKSSSGEGEWYEQISLDGKLSKDSRLSAVAERKEIFEDYSLTTCTTEAAKALQEFEVYVAG